MGQALEARLSKTISGTLAEVGWVSLKNHEQPNAPTIQQVTVTVHNLAGGANLTGFQLSTRANRFGLWVPVFDSSADWTSPAAGSKIQGSYGASTTDPTTLPTGQSMSFELVRITSDEGLRFEARTGGGETTIEISVGSDV